jgi:hypothetical protein
MTKALRHRCRNPRCRMKLPVPVDNEHQAFCTPGCHSSFYRSRCLVCEDPIRRKNDWQKFGSGHATCRAEYRRFPHVYDYNPLKTHPGSLDASIPLGGPHFTGLKSANETDRAFWRFDAAGKGWRWESEADWDEHRLYDRDGKLAACLWGVGRHWYLLHPKTIPFQSAVGLEAGKRLAFSIALANLPLDEATAARIERANANSAPFLARTPPDTTYDFKIAEAKVPGDPGPIPEFLPRAAP